MLFYDASAIYAIHQKMGNLMVLQGTRSTVYATKVGYAMALLDISLRLR